MAIPTPSVILRQRRLPLCPSFGRICVRKRRSNRHHRGWPQRRRICPCALPTRLSSLVTLALHICFARGRGPGRCYSYPPPRTPSAGRAVGTQRRSRLKGRRAPIGRHSTPEVCPMPRFARRSLRCYDLCDIESTSCCQIFHIEDKAIREFVKNDTAPRSARSLHPGLLCSRAWARLSMQLLFVTYPLLSAGPTFQMQRKSPGRTGRQQANFCAHSVRCTRTGMLLRFY
ncbi:hypothetical protein FA95DRAFT_853453 [Auriscalpium vulgare]|uniref:Uncharacterized protein n=1 Tax=Auriscalpium vulgare TaxID=40419 RepID=A0ACB8RAF6_9AGAM|nr:hypothetical protein FA95DRAFT_853453 [Auriscalpium vulgare]